MSFLLRLAARAMGSASTPLLQPKDRGLARVYRMSAARAAEEPPPEEPEGDMAAPARATRLARAVTTEATGWDDGGARGRHHRRHRRPRPRGPERPARCAAARGGVRPPGPRSLARRPAERGHAQARRAGRRPAALPGPGHARGPGPAGPGGGAEGGVRFVFRVRDRRNGPKSKGRTRRSRPRPPAGAPFRGHPLRADPPPFEPAGPFQPTAGPAFERPQVIVEQVDVLIHEPQPAPGPDLVARRRARSFDARYLRRL